jgi:nitrous oxide reductase accessory protein NosL
MRYAKYLVLVLLGSLLLAGCGKQEEQKAPTPAPSQGTQK